MTATLMQAKQAESANKLTGLVVEKLAEIQEHANEIKFISDFVQPFRVDARDYELMVQANALLRDALRRVQEIKGRVRG